MSQKFIKKQEDFTCGHCGQKVTGNGYTNHCPVCLFSRHVDIYPGDRDGLCGGLMAPIGLLKQGEKFIIIHRCLDCGEEKRNKAAPDDDLGSLLAGML
ncbi:MAG: RNHCP domain-containing protein [Candidatus Paceibacterota bacterium]